MMNDQPEEGPPDHPAPSMDLTAVQQSTSNSMDNSANALPPAADEESPREEKRMVEPQLVLEDVIQSSNPAIRFLRGRSAKGLNRMSSTVIDIAQLPPDVAENLRPYDLNGDGMISLTELVHGAITQHQQEENVIFFRRVIIGFVLIWLVTMGAFFGVVYGAIEASKDSKVDETNSNKGGATLVTRDNAYVVQTANSDFFVGNDGSAYVRAVTSQAYEAAEGSDSGEQPNFHVMKTSAANANITFSSNIPDEILMELKSISIRSAAGAHLSLQVHGVLRMPTEGVATVGAVTLLTHIGRIVIDGTSVSFYDDTEVAIFENAGFIVTEGASVGGRRRRLLDGIQALFGIFNAVSSLKGWDASAPSYANIPPPKLPTNFIMHSRRFAPCVANPKQDGSVISYMGYLGGDLPKDAGVDYCDMLQMDKTLLATTYKTDNTVLQRFIETEYVIYRVGDDYLRVEYVHPLHPNVTFVEVLDNSDPHNPVQFHYNVDTATKGLKVTTITSDYDLVEFKGPIYYYNNSHVTEQNLVEQTLSSPFDYLGTTTFQGADVRIWALHLMNNTLHAFWYDSVASQEVKRIDYGDFGMLEIVGLTTVNDTEASSMSYLFTRPIADVTTVVTEASANLPYKVGINPYEPFVDSFRKKLDAAGTGHRRLFEESDFDGREQPVQAPPELLIPNAEARRRRHVPGTEQKPAPRSAFFPAPLTVVPTAEYSEQTQLATESFAVQEPAAEEEEEAVEPLQLEDQQDQQGRALTPAVGEDWAAPVINPLPSKHGWELEVAKTCPAGWVGSDTMCYQFYSQSYMGTWDTCKSLCASTPGSSMLCIQNVAQNQFIYDNMVARGTTNTWIGLKATNGNFKWDSSCASSFYYWSAASSGGFSFGSASSSKRWAAFAGSTRWSKLNQEAFNCACQNAFYSPTAQPTSMAPSARPTGPTPVPTRVPTSSKPTTTPTMAATTYRPTPLPGTRPYQLPPIPAIPIDIAPIANFITRGFGCAAENKCDNYYLWYSTINAPYMPVLTATGNNLFACVFSSGLDVPIPIPVMPVVEIAVEAGVEIAFCNDMSALDYVLGTISVSVGITGMDYVQPPFDQLFSWQVATVGIGLSFYVSEAWCAVNNGVATYSSDEAYGLFRYIASTSRGPQICRCLERGQTYPGLMYIVSGPDISGVVLAAIPVFTPLAPFLLFTRITNGVLVENFPYVCDLSLSRTSMTVDLVLNLGMYSYSVNVISFQMSMVTKTGDVTFIGAYMNNPRGLNPFISQEVFNERYLDGAYNTAGNALIALVNRNAFIWLAVVRLGGIVANAAANYFAASIDGGQLLESIAGEYVTDLFKIFQPRPVVIQGCFNPTIRGPQCNRRRRIFGRSFCVGWSMPEIHCGSTSQCIKYCR